MNPWIPSLRTRGSATNPKNRFERIEVAAEPEFVQPDPDPEAQELPPVPTQLFVDPSRRALAHNESPDLDFDTSLNPYRGCEHGCSYCYARPTHEYLGFSLGLDFETKILVKRDLPELLRKALAARRWQPRTIAVGAVTDPYQPAERRLRITRGCLEVLNEFRNPFAIVTKSSLVVRDLDLLAQAARFGTSAVFVSVTTLDPALQRALEPRAASPRRRLRTIEALARAGVPVGVMIAPVIPAVTDHEIPGIVEAAAVAGARFAGSMMLRLPHGLKDLFEAWLERHLPERKQKVLNRIREMRGGGLNDPRFHSRMRGSGFYAEQTRRVFELARRRAGIAGGRPVLSTTAFRRPAEPQLSLFS